MPDDKLQQKLVDYVQDVHAMEQNVSTMLTSMISTTDDPQITEMLKHHKEETEEHERRLRERLDAMGGGTSTTKAVGGIGAALFKSVGDMARTDKPGKNARDGFMTEHMEIAAYELLERLAKRARDEQVMARKIASNRNRFLDLTLATPGFLAE
jgi:ferritin-like metal-binding protein YciE